MKLELEVTQVNGGFIIAIPEYQKEACAATPRRAGKRAGEMIEEVLIAETVPVKNPS